MLTEICAYLKNYFDYGKFIGHIIVSDGVPYCDGEEIAIEDGQYFALFRQHFCLGVFKKGTDLVGTTKDIERGAVWLMDISQAVLDLAKEIADWQALYGAVDGTMLSPYTSESFGNYSYSKRGSGSSDGSGGGSPSWQDTFAARLALYRKIAIAH